MIPDMTTEMKFVFVIALCWAMPPIPVDFKIIFKFLKFIFQMLNTAMQYLGSLDSISMPEVQEIQSHLLVPFNLWAGYRMSGPE